MPILSGNFNQLAGSDIVVHVNEAIAQGKLTVKRHDILYPGFIPAESIDTAVDEGALYYSKLFDDGGGVASWRATGSNDVPTVGTTMGKVSVPIFKAGISSTVDVEDQRNNAMRVSKGYSEDIFVRTAQLLNLAVEYFKERLVFFGDGIYDSGAAEFYPGLINHPLIPQATVAQGGGVGNPTEWAEKTEDEIIFDITTAISALYSSTRTVMMPTDIYVPVTQFNILASRKAGALGNDQVILRFASQQNIRAQIDGKEINILPLLYLEGAGAGGSDRMMIVCKEADNYMMANPIDFRLYDVQKFGYLFNYFAESKISPLQFPWPKFAAYWDGI